MTDLDFMRAALQEALAGTLPAASTPEKINGEFAPEEDVQKALHWLMGRKVGAIGEAPVGFTPCVYDGAKLNSLFGKSIKTCLIIILS